MTGARTKPEVRGPRLRTVLLTGVAAFLFFFVMQAPASLLWHWAGTAVPRLQLVGVQGSLWRGQADAAYYGGVPLGTVQWRWQPLALISGHWRNRVLIESRSARVDGGVGWSLAGSLVGRDLSADLLLSDALNQYLPAGAKPPIAVEGALNAELDAVNYADGRWERLDGEVALRSLSVGGVTYGDATAVLGAREGGLTAQFRTLPGAPVQLEGMVSLSPEGEYRLSLAVEDPAAMGKEVGNLVKALASNADGRWRLDWKGRL